MVEGSNPSRGAKYIVMTEVKIYVRGIGWVTMKPVILEDLKRFIITKDWIQTRDDEFTTLIRVSDITAIRYVNEMVNVSKSLSCPKCHGSVRHTHIILASNPPMSEMICDDCGYRFAIPK